MHLFKRALLILLAVSAAANLPAEETAPARKISGTLTVGYDSRYVLYGYRLSRHLWHTDIWLTCPLTDKITLNGGTWYGHLSNGTYREIDGYVGMDYALSDRLYAGWQYSIFGYIEVPFTTSNQAHELAAHLSYWGERFNFSVRNQYDNEATGSLTRMMAGYTLPLSEQSVLKIDAEAGYAFSYYINGSAWNHAQIKASLPFQVGTRFSLTPFVARSIPLAAIDGFEENETYFGLSGSVSF